MQHYISRRAVLKDIAMRPSYVFLALLIALLFYLANALILQWKNLDILTLQNVFTLFTVGVYYLLTRVSFYSLLLISMLTGALLALLIYRGRMARITRHGSVSALSSLGVLTGMALPGCASCGIGLAAALGIGSSLAVLPFKGIEISVLAVILLSFSIAEVAKSMTIHAICKVPRKRRYRGF